MLYSLKFCNMAVLNSFKLYLYAAMSKLNIPMLYSLNLVTALKTTIKLITDLCYAHLSPTTVSCKLHSSLKYLCYTHSSPTTHVLQVSKLSISLLYSLNSYTSGLQVSKLSISLLHSLKSYTS